MKKYEFHTDPFSHQLEIFNKTLNREAFGVFWEQGTGKTKLAIDQACALYEDGAIDFILVVAPAGVHLNWTNEEIPAHMPLRIREQVYMHAYLTEKSKTKWHQKRCKDLMRHLGLKILSISYDGFMTEAGKKLAWAVLKEHKVFYVLDESDMIKTPKAKRTKSIVASGKHGTFRRILTGTPVADKPFDIYSQVRFLDEKFWHDLGMGNFYAFKQHFGEWFSRDKAKEVLGYDPGYDKLIEYKNLDELHRILKLVGSRVLKDDVLDLPPKLYSKRVFSLSLEQRHHYDELASEYFTELQDGSMVDATMAIVRLLRLQQIACGYVQVEADEPVRMVGKRNPRLDVAVDILERLGHKAIVWSRFRKDIDQLMDALGDKAVQYDGRCSSEQSEQAKNDFQRGDAQFFVANVQRCTGITLTSAKTVVYYSNNFKLRDRLQSEDRAHRSGLSHPVGYIDLIAADTVDEKIVRALRNKRDIASTITGDQLLEWI